MRRNIATLADVAFEANLIARATSPRLAKVAARLKEAVAAGEEQETVFALLDLHHVRFRHGETIEAFEDVLDPPREGDEGARARAEFVRQWSWARLEFEQAMTGLVPPKLGHDRPRPPRSWGGAAAPGPGAGQGRHRPPGACPG